MNKITYGLLWFQLLLMNIGLGAGTIGLVLLLQQYSPLIEFGVVAMTLGLMYVFFYVLLVVGVVGLDAKVLKNGIKSLNIGENKCIS